ncbi:MAG: hypothetical protein V4801_37900 [Burkholderia gladioli]
MSGALALQRRSRRGVTRSPKAPASAMPRLHLFDIEQGPLAFDVLVKRDGAVFQIAMLIELDIANQGVEIGRGHGGQD